MCGIVGFIEKHHNLNSVDTKIFEHLLLVDTLRGEDSTGAFCAYKSGSLAWVKQATNPLNLFNQDNWSKFKTKSVASGALFVGHNRKATVGEIKTTNAHPFIRGNTALVHNGNASNWKTFVKDAKDITVDSDAVAYAFDKDGWEKVLPEIEGAYTFVWYNMKDKVLRFARNDQRPLWFCETAHHWMWASEPVFMEFVLAKNNVKYKKPYEMEVHTVVSYDIRNKSWSNTKYNPKKVVTYSHWSGEMGTSESFCEGIVSKKPWGETKPPLSTMESSTTKSSTQNNYPVQNYPTQSSKIPKTEIDVDMIVTIDIQELRMDTVTGHVKLYGKCTSPSVENCDVICKTDETSMDAAIKKYNKDLVWTGRVSQIVESVCGLSAWVKDINLAETISDYDGNPWYTKSINYLALENKGKCDFCDATGWNAGKLRFSRVSHEVVNGFNTYYVECPVCVYDQLPVGKEKDEFAKNCPSALQVNEQKLLPSPV